MTTLFLCTGALGLYVLAAALLLGRSDAPSRVLTWPLRRGLLPLLLLVLAGCAPLPPASLVYSPRAGAPYFRGLPGGSDLKVQTQTYDYRVYGSRSFGGTTR